jgi:hypothetical protein
MFSNIPFLGLLFQSIFIGFGIFTFTTLFIRKKENNASAGSLIDSATLVIRFGTTAYLLMWLVNLGVNPCRVLSFG